MPRNDQQIEAISPQLGHESLLAPTGFVSPNGSRWTGISHQPAILVPNEDRQCSVSMLFLDPLRQGYSRTSLGRQEQCDFHDFLPSSSA